MGLLPTCARGTACQRRHIVRVCCMRHPSALHGWLTLHQVQAYRYIGKIRAVFTSCLFSFWWPISLLPPFSLRLPAPPPPLAYPPHLYLYHCREQLSSPCL